MRLCACAPVRLCVCARQKSVIAGCHESAFCTVHHFILELFIHRLTVRHLCLSLFLLLVLLFFFLLSVAMLDHGLSAQVVCFRQSAMAFESAIIISEKRAAKKARLVYESEQPTMDARCSSWEVHAHNGSWENINASIEALIQDAWDLRNYLFVMSCHNVERHFNQTTLDHLLHVLIQETWSRRWKLQTLQKSNSQALPVEDDTRSFGEYSIDSDTMREIENRVGN